MAEANENGEIKLRAVGEKNGMLVPIKKNPGNSKKD